MKIFLTVCTSLIVWIGVLTDPAAASIQVEGDENGAWVAIADEDFDPDQTVTDFGAVPVNTTKEIQYRIVNQSGGDQLLQKFSSSHSAFAIVKKDDLPALIPAGEAYKFNIAFTPVVGNPTSRIEITLPGLAPDDIYAFNVTGESTLGPMVDLEVELSSPGFFFPVSHISPTRFGEVEIPEQVTRRFRLENSGTTALTISSIGSSDPQNFEILSTPGTLAPGATDEFEIRYEPESEARHDGLIIINSNAPQFRFPVSGSAEDNRTGSEIAVSSPTSPLLSGQEASAGAGNDFAEVELGLSRDVPFLIENTAVDTLTISGVSSDDPLQFEVISMPSSVAPSGQGIIVLRFTPSSLGVQTGVISIAHDDTDGDEAPFLINVLGSGVVEAPTLRVSGQTRAEIPNGAAADIALGTVFQNVDFFPGTKFRSFKLENTGSAELQISSIRASGVFGSSGFNFEFTISPGDYQIIEVIGDVLAPGVFEETLSIVSNAGSFGCGLQVSSGDYDPALSLPESKLKVETPLGATVASAQSSFQSGTNLGAVGTNAQAMRSFVLRNTGNRPLEILSISSSPSSHYTVADLASTTIAPGEEQVLEVTFAPANTGSHQADVTITTDSYDTRSDVFILRFIGEGVIFAPQIQLETLSGTVIPVGAAASREFSTTFGDVSLEIPGDFSTRRLVVRNIGTAELSFSVPSRAPFFILGSGAVLPGQSAELLIDFVPQSVGDYRERIQLASNDGATGIYDFEVSGRATVLLPEVTNFEVDGNDMVVTFKTIESVSIYGIEYSSDLDTWLRVPSQQPVSEGDNLKTVRLPGMGAPAAQGRRFIRVTRPTP